MTLDQRITDAALKCSHAQTEECRMYWAREAIRLRFLRGDFSVIAHLDETTLEALAIAMLRENT